MMKVLLCSILLNLLLLLNLSANEYKVSVLANYGEARAIKEWQPTIDYLNKKIIYILLFYFQLNLKTYIN